MENSIKYYMVDGQLLDPEQVKAVFNYGNVDVNRMACRHKVALRMVGAVAPSGRFLDVGCYGGVFVAAVSQQYPGIQTWGVDYFEDNIAIAQMLYPQQAQRYQKMSVYALDFPDGFFDCVAFLEVIEHIDRPVDAVRQINRVLRDGGYLVLSTPNANAHAWRLLFQGTKQFIKKLAGKPESPSHQIFFENVEWNRHIYSWTVSTLNTLLISNGFEYVEHQFYGDSVIRRLFPQMGEGMVFFMRKAKPAPATIV